MFDVESIIYVEIKTLGKKSPIHASVREQSHVARVGVRQDCLGAVVDRDPLKSVCDDSESLIPRDAPKGALAFPSNTLQGVEDAFRAVDTLKIPVHFGAKKTLSERVFLVSSQGDGPPVFVDPHIHDARVRTVVGADDLDNAFFYGSAHFRDHPINRGVMVLRQVAHPKHTVPGPIHP